jgi:hypothetical protein
VIRAGEKVFVDTGAWIALAEEKDPLHAQARAQWEAMERAGARVATSVPVVIETFTFLDRRGSRELALRWKGSLDGVPRFEVLGSRAAGSRRGLAGPRSQGVPQVKSGGRDELRAHAQAPDPDRVCL